MGASLWFVVPAHGRLELAGICLRQLRHTCDELKKSGIDACAVVIADDENLDIAHGHGFWGYEQENALLGRKFNDGYNLAAREGVDFVVPLGSDDWIHHSLITGAPFYPDRIRCARRLVMVAEDGQKFMRLKINYDGGIGMRIMPVALLQPLGYRPADEDRRRGVDTSTLMRLQRAHRFELQLEYYDTESEFQIVDFKSPGANLNTWEMCEIYGAGPELDPWPALAQHYPADSVSSMWKYYEGA